MKFKDKKAIYLQIADLFLENIVQKKWSVGEKIPSVREMAVALEVNPNTAMRTYTYLEDLGIIFNKRGIGFFVGEMGHEKALAVMKKEFIEHDIPNFYNTMHMLEMTLSETETLFAEKNSNRKTL